MYYLSPTTSAASRAQLRNILLNNGDTHIYLYTRSNDKLDSGVVPQGSLNSFGPKLDELNRAGLKPILWMTPESRHGYHKGSLEQHRAYMKSVVDKYDDKVEGYVVCLECDDYWNPAQVQHLTRYVKTLTNKPVGVHLTPGVGGFRGDINYYKDADYIYLQISNNTSDKRAKEILAEAQKLGIPVIAAEYSHNGTSAKAKRRGDMLCANGALGTGSGRNVSFCGKPVTPEKSPKKGSSSGTAVAVGIVIGVAILVNRYRKKPNDDIIITLDSVNGKEDMKIGKLFSVTDQSSLYTTYERTNVFDSTEYDQTDRIMFGYQFKW